MPQPGTTHGTPRASRSDMQVVVAVLLAFACMSVPGPGSGAVAPGGGGDASPSAADLLRAKRRADEARRRLEMPREAPPSGWKRGGDGWWRAWERGERAPPAPGSGTRQ